MAELAGAVVARARRHAAEHGRLPEPGELGAMVRELGGVLGRADLAELGRRVRAELLGAGPLQPLLDEPGVSDVLVNGPDSVWVDRGSGLERTDVRIGDRAAVRALATRLAAAGGQRLDDAAPVVDARLPDGTRLHAVLPPIAADGALLSLRVLRGTAFRIEELVACGSLAPEVADLLVALVERRASLLVSGATGSGKTTLLSALLSRVPPTERIVCIEEAAELTPDHPHVVRLLARRPNVEGAGEVDLTALVRNALRMRPDRIVLGECRGPEVREMFTALNSGHEGGCATLHANTVHDVPARLEALGSLAGMSGRAVAAQAASALQAVLHLRRHDGRRYLAQVGAVTFDGGLRVGLVLSVDPSGAVTRGPAWAEFVARWAPGGAR